MRGFIAPLRRVQLWSFQLKGQCVGCGKTWEDLGASAVVCHYWEASGEDGASPQLGSVCTTICTPRCWLDELAQGILGCKRRALSFTLKYVACARVDGRGLGTRICRELARGIPGVLRAQIQRDDSSYVDGYGRAYLMRAGKRRGVGER